MRHWFLSWLRFFINNTHVEPNIMHYDAGLSEFPNYCINCNVLLRNNNNGVGFWWGPWLGLSKCHLCTFCRLEWRCSYLLKWNYILYIDLMSWKHTKNQFIHWWSKKIPNHIRWINTKSHIIYYGCMTKRWPLMGQ